MKSISEYTSIFENSQKKNLKEYFHAKDDLLEGITFEDLIVTLQTNEPTINSNIVNKVFEELLKEKIKSARYELKSNINQIIKDAIG